MRLITTLTATAVTALALLASPAAAGPDHAAHGGRHGGHVTHAAQGGKHGAHGGKHHGKHHRKHGGHAMLAPPRGMAETPATPEFMAAHHRMMRNMSQPYTGDPDVDFRIQMIPHHQGAIDMARVALKHARSPWTRQLAEAVILEQQREIAEMQAWLARRGVGAPQAGGPQYVITTSSLPRHEEEAGTLDELRGQSWAPSSGIR
jgi:hypothetical protein